MKQEMIKDLWDIFIYIRIRWGVNDSITIESFNEIINHKITLNKKYYDYYQLALSECQRLYEQVKDMHLAIELLYTNNQLPLPKVPEIAQYVLLEFMQINVVHDGYKIIDFKNYAGAMGGSFDQSAPPYRTYVKQDNS